MKKIDILVPFSGRGGAEKMVNRVALHLIHLGHQVRVVEMVWNHLQWLDPSVPFYPLSDQKVDHIDRFYDFYATFLTREGTPDVILATPWPYLTYIARKAVRTMGCEENCRIVAWLQGPVATYETYGVGGIQHLTLADRILCLTKKEADKISGVLGETKAFPVKNPVDFTQCQRNVPEKHPLGYTLLYVGRLSEEKRVDLILKAMACAESKWSLVVIGDGDERQSLEQLAAELLIEERVEFCGWQEQPWSYLSDRFIDFLVIASEYEGYPLVGIEAMVAGIPVISTPVDGMIESITPGVNGYLFEHDNPQQLSFILDCIATGKLPIPEAEALMEAARDFREDVALENFSKKLLS
ncbi:MAG: glycosyltransferase [Lachnospiraceae bacterium]|nr:glycosyltransferase [Lachnospiraceae bacterium]